MLSSIWRPRPGKRRSSSRTIRRKVSASTSSSVAPPVNRRAAWPEKWTRGILSVFPAKAGTQETRVIEAPVLVVDVFLVERPADPLGHAALDLAFDIARVDGAADILHRGVAQDLDLPRLLVDFDVADMRRKAGPGALSV